MKTRRQSNFKEFDKKVSKMQFSQETKDGLKALKILLLSILLQASIWVVTDHSEQELISPIPEVQASELKPSNKEELKVVEYPTHIGIASFYSRAGCVGCSPTMTMANGKPLNDSALTVAFNRAKLGTKVRITNEKNGQSVVATVTDRGGFEKPKFNVNGVQRIVDLTIGTRDAIKCSNLCKVKVEVL